MSHGTVGYGVGAKVLVGGGERLGGLVGEPHVETLPGELPVPTVAPPFFSSQPTSDGYAPWSLTLRV